MEIVYNVIVPIIVAIIGGFVCGLFTYLGIEHSLRKNGSENGASKTERNQYRNSVIKMQRPELTIIENPFDIKDKLEIYLLPYINPILKDDETIEFQYTNEIYDENYWGKHEIILQNTGKRTIQTMFLQSQYENRANVYSNTELYAWQQMGFGNYYQDKLCCNIMLKPDEKFKLIIHFPLSFSWMENIPIDMYMRDEDGNFWHQFNVNYENHYDSAIIAPDAYYMHLRQEYYQWFVYDRMYYTDNIKKKFYANSRINKVLEERKKANRARDEKHQNFIGNVNSGKIVLNHNYPISYKND
ncbi:MAG: hypothetical protein HFK10_09080 [Clostridia bacterium]|nr:hypothetical protein [Clostridia bacterium]